jgi:Histone RNA hairpin-binding protein RNA-binding domain
MHFTMASIRQLNTATPLNAPERKVTTLGKRTIHSRDDFTATSRPTKRCRCWADEAVHLALRDGIEKDTHRIAQRLKQIALGKNTLSYDAFVQAVPREERLREHPATPVVQQITSKRGFDGQVKRWRRMLFEFKEEQDRKDEKTRAAAASAARALSKNNDNSPAGASAVAGNVSKGNPGELDDLSDYDDVEDCGIELDGDGNLISMGVSDSPTGSAETILMSAGTPGGRRHDEVSSPEPQSVFGKF